MTTGGEATRKRFEALYRETGPRLLSYFLRRVDEPGRAADLLADTFLVAWRRVDAIPPGAEGVLWLFGVARRLLANDRRRTRSESSAADRLRAQVREHVVPDPADAVALCATVDQALARLPSRAREVLLLSALEGFTPAEIAVVTGRSVGSVRVALHRARTALAAQLGPGTREFVPAPA